MAQHAIETDGEPTESAVIRCHHCGDEIPGRPFYAFADVVWNGAQRTFVPTAEADAFCNVQCQRQTGATEAEQ